MKKVLNLYKPVGKTPLDIVEEFRRQTSEFRDIKMGYAGRLDPMAEGVLLILVGDENKKRDDYLHLDKEYEIEILFGVGTDSYDLLGKVEKSEILNTKYEINNELKKTLESFVGEIEQEFPPYSSKPVGGKPLFWWARADRLNEIDIPKTKRKIYNATLSTIKEINATDLHLNIISKLAQVKGEFRQTEIIEGWNEFFRHSDQAQFNIVKIKVSCSSGTYMRSLVNDIGKKMSFPTTTYSIIRKRVGEYRIEDSKVLL